MDFGRCCLPFSRSRFSYRVLNEPLYYKLHDKTKTQNHLQKVYQIYRRVECPNENCSGTSVSFGLFCEKKAYDVIIFQIYKGRTCNPLIFLLAGAHAGLYVKANMRTNAKSAITKSLCKI